MTLPAPRIDTRASREVVRQMLELLKVYTAEWPEFRPEKGASRALIEIFGRFAELIIERLNQVPEKNLLAFLDMIGASQLPPQSARAPLTFSLVNGSLVDGLVPAGTQVAAVLTENETTPVIFETENELVVTAARLVSLFAREPEQDRYADNSSLINTVSARGVPAFLGDKRLEHISYIGHDTLFSYTGLQKLQLDFQATKPLASFQAQWEEWDGTQWAKIPASIEDSDDSFEEIADGKEYLTVGGKLFLKKYLIKDGKIVFINISPLLQKTIAGFEKSWLRCRLLSPIVPATVSQTAAVHDDQLPEITSVNITATMGTRPDKPLPVEAAFTNMVQVDTTKDLFPFGEKPRVGDTLYLANKEAFSEKDSKVTLNINLGSTGVKTGRPELSWEFWDGQMWNSLGQVDPDKTNSAKETNYSDNTKAFTQNGENNQGGLVTFTFPKEPAATIVNGVENFWIRVRIVSGNYGEEAHIKLDEKDSTKYAYVENDPTKGYILVPATFRPPSISSIAIAYTLTRKDTPQVVLSYNDDFAFEIYTYPFKSSFKPFRHKTDAEPTVYLGFTLASGLKDFPNHKISLYAAMAEFKYGETPAPVSLSASARAEATSDEQPKLVWEYSSAAGWSELTVRDYTENLTRPGPIEFLAPTDFSERSEFGLSGYWLRVVWKSGEYLFDPQLRGMLINTAMAAQAVTVKDEVLGSSDGSKNQKFYTTRTPVLEGQQLDVREPEIPPASEREKIKEEGVSDPLKIIQDETGRPKEIWVRWKQVPDFYGSEPRDRHYVLDNLTGEVRFGDGRNGMIPPVGAGSIRMSLYRNGGGASGNRPAGAITQLKTTVPYVEKVINYLAATGGTDAETTDSLLKRAPRMLRHNHRAVTVKDYEDMAMLASPEVARARCIPLANVITDAEDDDAYGTETRNKMLIRDGSVSLIIVPRSTEDKPSPGYELIGRIRDFLSKWQNPLVSLVVAGPKYVGINVTTDVALETLDGANEIKLAIEQALSKYLHPLYGGVDGQGWDFGRHPHESNLYALIEAIPGVDYVESLKLTPVNSQKLTSTEESDEFKKAGNYFLVYSGTHTINLRFEEK